MSAVVLGAAWAAFGVLGVFSSLGPAARAQTTYTYTGASGTTSAPKDGRFSDGFDKPLTLTNGSYGANDATFLFGGANAYTATNDLTGALVLNVLRFTNTGNVTIARGTSANAKNQLVFNTTNVASSDTNPMIFLNNGTNAPVLVDQDMVFNADTMVSGSGNATFARALSGTHLFYQNGTGILTLTGQSSLSNVIFDEGTTLIKSGASGAAASLTTSFISVGNALGSSGSLTVSGVGNGGASTLSIGSNGFQNGFLKVGDSGSGSLNVMSGGNVNNTSITILGGYGSGSGMVTVSGVSGVGSASMASTLSTSSLYVGFDDSGSSVLSVMDGGKVNVNGSTYIASGHGSGTVTVSGVSGVSSGSMASTLSTGNLYVCSDGTSVLNIMDGGKVIASGVTNIGILSGSYGMVTFPTVTVSGVSNGGVVSTLSTGSLVVGAGSGTGFNFLNVMDGGKVNVNGTTNITYGSMVTVSGVSGVSSGSLASTLNTGSLYVGNDSILDVLVGGKVTASTSYLGGNNGTLTVSGVSGVGSGITASTLSTGDLVVGNPDNFITEGFLDVVNGGKVIASSTYLSPTTTTSSSLIINGGSLTTDTLQIGSGQVTAFKLTNPTAANGGGYALNIGGSNGSSAIGVAITDAAAGDGLSGSLLGGNVPGGPGGAGGIDKTGSGTLTLNAANTFSGGMQIDGGSVILGNTNALQNSTAIVNVNNGLNLNNQTSVTLGGLAGMGNLAIGASILTVGNNNASTTYMGILSGSGSLTKIGNGDLTLSGANTFSGRTRIQGGTLIVGNASALQNTTVSLQVDNGLNLNNMAQVSLGGLAGTGSLNRGSTNLSVGSNNADTTYSGVMSGAGSLTKTGSGTLSLTGASTASGMTTLTQGTVVASGTGLGTGRVTVGVAGTLGVGESLNTSRTAQGVNTLTLSSLTLAPNSSAASPQLTFNLGTSGVSDQLVLTGAGSNVFQLSSSGTFFLGFASATGANLAAGTYTLMSFTNQSNFQTLPALTAFQATASGNLVSLSTPANAFSYDTSSGHVVLRFTISGANTPEPSSLSLLGMGLGIGILSGLGMVGRVKVHRARLERTPFASSFFVFLPAALLALALGVGIGGGSGGGDVAHAQRLYVGGDGGQFGTLNAVNGNYNSIGITHVGISSTAVVLYGLGYAANGNLYGLSSSARLYQVDALTASLTLVGNVSGLVNGSTLGATADGTLYALSNSSLYSIDPTNAVASLRGPTGLMTNGGISGDGSSNLYITQGDKGTAFDILNQNTGAGTQIGVAGYGSVYALGYSTTNKTLYALNKTGGIYSVSTATGQATSTGKTYDTSADGAGVILAAVGFRVADSGVTPEPGSLVLVTLGGLPALGIVARRRHYSA